MEALTKRAKQLFLNALEQPAEARREFVRAACEADPELLRRVEGLLAADAEAAQRLGSLGAAAPLVGQAQAGPGLRAGDRVDAYRLQALIGSGGFGDVWLAEQELPLRRQVALKVLKPGMDTREVVARFGLERQALAIMEHDSIAKIFDAGSTSEGRPYFVMEWVDGLPITEHCNEHGVATRGRVRLMLEVCRAIQHAHQKGVIHRDIKPNNVLVAYIEKLARPKVIDFGIAKALHSVAAEGALKTRMDQIIGTPGYMSPEQFDESLDVDTRSDVYSLGALFYELLVGCPPLEMSSSNLLQIHEVIQKEQPKRPSSRLALRLQGHPAPAGQPSLRELRGDLDWIVMRCLEKRRDERYESVGALAEDLQRYLAGEAVSAGPRTLGYRASRFIGRHWRPILVGVAMLVLLVAGIVLTSLEAQRADRAKRQADVELVRAGAVASFLADLIQSIDPAHTRGRDTEVLEELFERASGRVEAASQGIPLVEAELRSMLGNAHYALGKIQLAKSDFEQAYGIRKLELGPQAAETLESLGELGLMTAEAGDYEEGARLLRSALQGYRAEAGPGDARTQRLQATLAGVLQNMGALEEARGLLLEVEASQQLSLGKSDEQTLRTMNNLAVVLSKLDELEAAGERYEFILAQQLESPGPDHPRTLATMNNLAGLCQKLGDFVRAEELLRSGLEAKLRVLPEGHPGILIGKSNLAQFLVQRDRLEEASSLRLEALASSQEHHGLDNRYTLTLLQTHGAALLKEQRPDEALEPLRTVSEHAPGVLGANSSLELAAEACLAEALLDLGRPAEAQAVFGAVLEVYEDLVSPNSPSRQIYPALEALILHASNPGGAARAKLEAAQLGLESIERGSWIVRVEQALAELGE